MLNIRINKTFGPYTAGQTVRVEADTTGTTGIPLDPYWRRRLQDAATDGCCEVVTESKQTPKRKRRGGSSDTEKE
jgi:hypothetical protein